MLNVPRCFNIRSLNQTSIWIAALGLYNITHRSIQTNTNKRKTLTVCPWNVLMGRSCPSLQTWIHMSVLQEANVLLLCQSTSSAGAVGGRRTDREICKYWKTLQPCKNITTFGVLYLSGRETAVWLLLYERPKWLLSAGTHKHVQLQNISLIHLLTSYMQHGSSYASCWLVYLVYSCTEDKIAFFIPLEGKDGTFVLAQCAGQVSCGAQTWTQSVSFTSTQSIQWPWHTGFRLRYANLPLDGSAVQRFKHIKRFSSTIIIWVFHYLIYKQLHQIHARAAG